jgi:hypothetical protein
VIPTPNPAVLSLKSAGFGAFVRVVNNLGTTPENLFSRYRLLCPRSLARRGRNHGVTEKKPHRIMSNKMPANVLKSECLRLFHLISAGVGAGWIVEGRMRNSMKLSHNQEAMLSL